MLKGNDIVLKPKPKLKTQYPILKDVEKVHQIYLNNRDSCFFTIGVHPHHANEFNLSSSKEMKYLIKKYKPHSVGETGLDFFRNISSYEEQLFAFEEQIKIAIDNNQPLFLHQRDAHADFMKVIKKALSSVRSINGYICNFRNFFKIYCGFFRPN